MCLWSLPESQRRYSSHILRERVPELKYCHWESHSSSHYLSRWKLLLHHTGNSEIPYTNCNSIIQNRSIICTRIEWRLNWEIASGHTCGTVACKCPNQICSLAVGAIWETIMGRRIADKRRRRCSHTYLRSYTLSLPWIAHVSSLSWCRSSSLEARQPR